MKIGIGLLVLGLLSLLGSCAPFGVTIYRATHSHPAASVALQDQGTTRTQVLSLDTRQRIQVALRLNIRTPSARKNTDDNAAHEYAGRYRFPIEYQVLDAKGRVLHRGHDVMAWDSGMRRYRHYDVGPDGGWMSVETGFDKFGLTPGRAVRVELHLGPDTTYGAHVQSGRLLVYDRVYRHTRLIVIGIGLAVLGLILAVVGAIVLIVRSVGSAPTRVSPAGGAAPGVGKATMADTGIDDRGARNWAMWCHLSALGGYVVPMAGIIAPLVVWLTGRERDPFIDEQGKEAVNFRLTLVLYYLVSFVLIFVVIGFFLLAAVSLFDLIMTIIAGVRANSGEHFRYPLSIRMVR